MVLDFCVFSAFDHNCSYQILVENADITVASQQWMTLDSNSCKAFKWQNLQDTLQNDYVFLTSNLCLGPCGAGFAEPMEVSSALYLHYLASSE